MSQQGDGDTSAAAAQPLRCNSDRYCLSPSPWAQPLPCCPHQSGSPTNLPFSDLAPPQPAFLPVRFYLFWISQLPTPYPPRFPLGSAPSFPAAPFRTPRKALCLCIASVRAEGACHRPQPRPLFFILAFPFFALYFFLFCFVFKETVFKLFLGL